MIKLKDLIQERLTLRDYDSEIEALRKEWDRLDNMGGQETRQNIITKKIDKLLKEKDRWENLYKAALEENADINHDAYQDFGERYDTQLIELAVLLKKSQGKGHLPWKTIPASLLKKVWLIFGKYNKINSNDLDKIADQMLTNIARLKASTDMMGHSQVDAREDLDASGYEFTDEEWDKWMSNYFTNSKGQWLLSDYGLPQLEKLYAKIYKSNTDEERLYAIDKALNIIHQRSDLAEMFVEGGTKTLNDIASQGGYTSNIDEQIAKIIKLKELIKEAKIYSKNEMINLGASGYLSKAYLMNIPISKIDGREPIPSASEDSPYIKGKEIKVPIEVEYDKLNDKYMLYSGNHRLHQAEINGDTNILAFVEII